MSVLLAVALGLLGLIGLGLIGIVILLVGTVIPPILDYDLADRDEEGRP